MGRPTEQINVVRFSYLGVADELVGILLWWAVAVHAVLSLLLALAGATIGRRATGYEIKSSTLPGFTGDEGKGVEAGVRCLMEEGP